MRPSLYKTYQHIEFAEPMPKEGSGNYKTFDVVGPICDSIDYFGKNRKLPCPNEGDCLVVYDAGAYGHSMSSNYELRLSCPEYMIDDNMIR